MVDVIIQKGQEILLIERGNNPFKGLWALPGGYVENNEEIITAALRELREETGAIVNEDELDFLGYFDAPDRDPRGRMISLAFGVEIHEDITLQAGDDARNVQWFSIHDMPDLAFDHRSILANWLEE